MVKHGEYIVNTDWRWILLGRVPKSQLIYRNVKLWSYTWSFIFAAAFLVMDALDGLVVLLTAPLSHSVHLPLVTHVYFLL